MFDLKKKKYKALDTIWLTFRASPVSVLLQIPVSIIIHAIMPTAAMALTTANFIDTATAILEGSRPYNDIYIPLILLLVVLGAFTAIGSSFELIFARIMFNLNRKVKPAMVKNVAALDFKHIENNESWELITRVMRNPAMSVREGFGAYMQFVVVVTRIVSVLVLIVTHVWWAAIVIFAFSAPMFWLAVKAGRKTYQAARDAEKFNRRTEYIGEVLIGRDAVDERTLFGYGGNVNERWKEQYEKGRILQLKVTAKYFLITKGSTISLVLVTLGVALTLIGPVINGNLSAGMFMGIMAAVFGMVNEIGWQMGHSLEMISRSGEYMKDMTAFLELNETKGALELPDADPPEFQSLEFRNVRFKYPTGDRYVLDGLSFNLKEGRHYSVVGKNGAGKTTIAKLLTGLYSGYEGEILINGKELREYPPSAIKAIFSVVYQDFAKYYIPLKDNIAVGDTARIDNAAGDMDEKIKSAAEQAGLDEIIKELKDGLDTPLGKILEGGQDISGGEWQHVAIARSLISRAPVKILDEPTAALDPISESRVYSDFERLMRGKTTVFISHRLGSTKLADEILVINDGKITERGTHDEIMALEGEYAEMFESQRGWYL